MSVDYRPPLTREQVERALEEKRLLTPVDAAELVGADRNLIDQWTRRGHLEPVRAGRRVWFWSEDVYDAHRRFRLRAAQDPTRGRNGKFVRRITTA